MSMTAAKSSASTRMRSLPVIAVTAVLTAAVAATQSSPDLAVLRAMLVPALVACSLIDLERRIIPNRITGPAALIALVAGLALDPGGEPGRLVWAALAGGFLLAAALASPSGMGMGDVKLLAVMGLFLGRPVVVALFVALLGSIAAAGYLARRHGVAVARKSAIPFGPYLAAGGILAALAGAPLMHAYLSIHI